jgi:hypothetical protein
MTLAGDHEDTAPIRATQHRARDSRHSVTRTLDEHVASTNAREIGIICSTHLLWGKDRNHPVSV